MILSAPIIKKNDSKVTYSVQVSKSKLPDLLWFEVDEKFGDYVSSSLDAALVALIIPAMYNGEDIVLKGKVSEDLVFQLNHDLQTVLLLFLPKLRRIQIYPEGFYDLVSDSSNVATGFSGGVDTFYTMAEHFYSNTVSEGYKVNHFFYNNVGAHGIAGQRLWLQKFHHLKKLPEKLNVPIIGVNSNLQDFFPNFRFIDTHTLRDASVGLLLQNGIGKYLYSSSIHFDHLQIGPEKVITFGDSVILPKLSTKSIKLMSVGSSISRMNKVIRVSKIPDSRNYLDVCVDEENELNCSRCIKCMKTQFAFDIIGQLRHYDNVFNNEIYLKNRFRFITLLHRSKSFHFSELLEYARKYNYPIPFKTKIASHLRYYAIRNLLTSK